MPAQSASGRSSGSTRGSASLDGSTSSLGAAEVLTTGHDSCNESRVKVVARIRPPVTAEEQQDVPAYVVNAGNRSIDSSDGRFRFELDHVFDETASQEDVYEHIGHSIVDDVLQGYNGTILSYGQTGSGKTYCTFGPSLCKKELYGIVPRAAHQVVSYLESTLGRCQAEGEETNISIRCSFLEVYRERMRDLLNPLNAHLKVKEIPGRGPFVDGLTQESVTSVSEVLQLLRSGTSWRAVAATRQNQDSSRSHAIFVMHVEQHSSTDKQKIGKLTIADLAGSERVSRSQSTGETLEEAKKINMSLTALGKVIDALAEQRPHVPYRDSTLTRVLEEGLGGNSQTALLVAASACSQHYDETLSSLRFATRASKVRTQPRVNYMYTSDQLVVLVGQLQRQLSSAQKEIAHLSGTSVIVPPSPLQRARRVSCPEANQPSVVPARSRSVLALRRPADEDATGTSARMISKQTSSLDSTADRAGNKVLAGGATTEETTSATGDRRAAPNDPVQFLRSRNSKTIAGCSSSWSTGTPSSANSAKSLHEEESAESDTSRGKSGDEASLHKANLDLHVFKEALIGQEQALQQAGLLTIRDDPWRRAVGPPSLESARGASSSDGLPTNNPLLNERWQALRHAVDARALSWKLSLERHKTDGLVKKLDARDQYVKDLEQLVEDAYRQINGLKGDLQAIPQNSWTVGNSTFRSSPWHAAANAIHAGRSSVVDGIAGGGSSSSTSSIGSTGNVQAAFDGYPPAAGTGETGTPSAPRPGSRCTASAQEAEVHNLKQSNAALEQKVAELQSQLSRKGKQVSKLSSDLVLRDLRISALRHEGRVKDALLANLNDEVIGASKARDRELETLLEQAVGPLLAKWRAGFCSQQPSC